MLSQARMSVSLSFTVNWMHLALACVMIHGTGMTGSVVSMHKEVVHFIHIPMAIAPEISTSFVVALCTLATMEENPNHSQCQGAIVCVTASQVQPWTAIHTAKDTPSAARQ